MTENGRPAFDLLWEWIASDRPVNYFGKQVVYLNRENKLDYGAGLRDLILDIRSACPVPVRELGPSCNRAYLQMCRDMKKHPDYPRGYPPEDGAAVWTMDQISDAEFGAVNWTELADRLFPELDAAGYEK